MTFSNTPMTNSVKPEPICTHHTLILDINEFHILGRAPFFTDAALWIAALPAHPLAVSVLRHLHYRLRLFAMDACLSRTSRHAAETVYIGCVAYFGGMHAMFTLYTSYTLCARYT